MSQSRGDALWICSCVWKCLTGRDKQWYVCFCPVPPCSRVDKQLETISAVMTPSFCRHNEYIQTPEQTHVIFMNAPLPPPFPFVLSHSYISRVNSIHTLRTLLPYRLNITNTGCGLPFSCLPPSPCFLDFHRCLDPQRNQRHRGTPGDGSLETVG